MIYTTTIKEQYKERIQTFFWSDNDDELVAIMTMDNMTLLWCPETNFIVDIFNNKIETFKIIPEGSVSILVEAKTEEYATRYAIQGTYEVTGYTSMGVDRPMVLNLKSVNGGMDIKILPSRLKIVSVEDCIV